MPWIENRTIPPRSHLAIALLTALTGACAADTGSAASESSGAAETTTPTGAFSDTDATGNDAGTTGEAPDATASPSGDGVDDSASETDSDDADPGPTREFFEPVPIVHPEPRGDGTLRLVETTEELEAALDDAQSGALAPGSVIRLAAGTYLNPDRTLAMRGEPEAPYVIDAAPGDEGEVVIQYREGRPGSFLRIVDAEWLEVHNLTFSHDEAGEPAFEGINIGSYSNATKGSHHITIRRCDIGHVQQALVLVRSDSSDIELIGNEIHHSAAGGDRRYAEGIYVGKGATLDHEPRDILIERNHIHHVFAEAVDIKLPASTVTIRGNYIHDIEVKSQGAVTAIVNARPATMNYDASIRIEDNWIRRVRTREHNGDAIVVGKGSAIIRNNVVWDIEGAGIRTNKNFAPGFAEVFVDHNTVWDTGRGAIEWEAGTDGEDCPTCVGPQIASQVGNLTDEMTSACTATPVDFVGPLVDDADAGMGVGSGFLLASDSDAVDGAAPSDVEVDVTGLHRDDTPDCGAYELEP